MKEKVFNTTDAYSPLVIRLVLGLVIFAHGAQKLFGWFGGYGFTGTMGYFTDVVGLPWLIGFFVILLETFGVLLLMTGMATRVMAAFYILLPIGIALSVHVENGFFMNWFGNQQGEGYEYFLLWIGMAASLLITGAGRYSIDQSLFAYEKNNVA